jgi:hypothetical protein
MGYQVERQRRSTSSSKAFASKRVSRDLIVDGAARRDQVGRAAACCACKQLLTYLRLTKQPVGLLINFGGETLKEGFRRLVNDYRPSASPRLRVNKILPSSGVRCSIFRE